MKKFTKVAEVVNPKKPLQFNVKADELSQMEKDFYAKVMADDFSVEKLSDFTGKNQSLAIRLISRGFDALAFEDKDRFVHKFQSLTDDNGRNTLWQSNHRSILSAISNLTREKNRFPTRSEISAETCLSQQTINKHLKDYFGSEEYNQKRDEFIVMRERVLAGMFKSAIEGDARAAKVFLAATEQFEKPAVVKTLNNYIQINGVVITQEQLKELPVETLNQVHEMIASVLQPATLQNLTS